MPPTFINPLPILISLTAVFSVFVHDAQLNSVAMTAMSLPAITSDYGHGAINLLPNNQHIQSESSSFLSSTYSLRSQQPTVQPRNEDDKKYIAQRRIMGNTFGNDYYWPSI
jgi:hypothetical protein